jgi:hypothetical protein
MAKTMRKRTRVVPSTAGVEINIMSAWPTELQQLDLDQRGVLVHPSIHLSLPGCSSMQVRWLLLGVIVVVTTGNSHAQHTMDAANNAADPPEVATSDTGKRKTAFEELDKDADGRVTRKEFTVGNVGGSDVAFSCMDADMNGDVTPQELNKLIKAFYRSHLSQVSPCPSCFGALSLLLRTTLHLVRTILFGKAHKIKGMRRPLLTAGGARKGL